MGISMIELVQKHRAITHMLEVVLNKMSWHSVIDTVQDQVAAPSPLGRFAER